MAGMNKSIPQEIKRLLTEHVMFKHSIFSLPFIFIAMVD